MQAILHFSHVKTYFTLPLRFVNTYLRRLTLYLLLLLLMAKRKQ